jgi:hypothetical protein
MLDGEESRTFEALYDAWLTRHPSSSSAGLAACSPPVPLPRRRCRRHRARPGQDHPHPGQQQAHRFVLDRARHCAPMLSDMCSGDAVDDEMLHDILKDRRGLYTTTVLPSGEIVKNYRSISFHTMNEHERAKFIDWAFETLSKWLGVDVETLTKEAKEQAA